MNQKSLPVGGIAFSILIILLLIGVAGLIPSASPLGTLLFLGVGVIVAGMLFLFVMLSLQSGTRDTAASQRVRAILNGEKPKHGENLAELMSVLSDDDLYDLRRHIKRRLLEQAYAGDDQEFESFEALLADVEAKRKRR